jgi:dienelactone hydrolase
LQLHDDAIEKGVRERHFIVERSREPVPGVLWTPADAVGARPLVLIGHGAAQHKRSPFVLSLARRFVRHLGCAAVAIDLPHHGERAPLVERNLSLAERQALLGSEAFGLRNHDATQQAVADWKTVIDAAQAFDDVGYAPIGYWGISMGTRFGVPLISVETRIIAAVLGLFAASDVRQLEAFGNAARGVKVPMLFLVQWDDEIAPRELALGLFDLFGSAEKTLHANPGRHAAVPPTERAAAERFFRRHLFA